MNSHKVLFVSLELIRLVHLEDRRLEILLFVYLGIEVDVLDKLLVADVHDLLGKVLADPLDPEVVHYFHLIKHLLLVF